MVPIITDPGEMQRWSESQRIAGKRIGVVPTMGALHEGHLSLIRLARERADKVITTIFVNPMQFGPGEDFERYPRDPTRDVELCTATGTDAVFLPDMVGMYPEGFATSVNVEGITEVLEGAIRPGHFRGVATIVTKLFHITKPHVAVFGQKDAQQIAVIKRMVADLNIDVSIAVAPILREKDGLAMSSRNAYLTPRQREEAVVLFRALQLGENIVREGERNASKVRKAMKSLIGAGSSGVTEYVSLADNASLKEVEVLMPGTVLLLSLAVRFGGTRLIDNIVIQL
jgi:pantoate--beta-alanine ligase